jgi:hypothetical protein
MFKDKTSKKRFQNVDVTRDLSTLDAMHNKIISNYNQKIIDDQSYIEKINKLEINYKNINDEIIKYCNNNIKNDLLYSNLWNSNIQIREELKNIQNEIKNINYFDEIEYYENTSSILFNYYEMIEKQSLISSNKYKSKSILDSFNVNKEENKIEEDDLKTVEKSDLVDQYLSITNKYHIKKTNNDNIEISFIEIVQLDYIKNYAHVTVNPGCHAPVEMGRILELIRTNKPTCIPTKQGKMITYTMSASLDILDRKLYIF